MSILAVALAFLVTVLDQQQPPAEPKKMKVIAEGFYSPVEKPTRWVVRDATAYGKMRAALGEPEALPQKPDVDWSKEMLVAVAMGTRMTGGYQVKMDSVARRSDGVVVVRFIEIKPKPGDAVFQALTSPYIVVRTPRLEGRVEYVSVPPPADRE